MWVSSKKDIGAGLPFSPRPKLFHKKALSQGETVQMRKKEITMFKNRDAVGPTFGFVVL
jgi:hypothetical protein